MSILLRDYIMDGKQKYIPKDYKQITPSLEKSYQFKILNTTSLQLINENYIKVPKV